MHCFQVCTTGSGAGIHGLGSKVSLTNSHLLSGMTNFPSAVIKRYDTPFVPPSGTWDGLASQRAAGLNLPNFQTKQKCRTNRHSPLFDWVPPPQPAEITLKCLVHIITSNWQIAGSDQTEIVSLCLINTYLIMVNCKCLIMEEQSCQSGDKREPSGSLITICWCLASCCWDQSCQDHRLWQVSALH